MEDTVTPGEKILRKAERGENSSDEEVAKVILHGSWSRDRGHSHRVTASSIDGHPKLIDYYWRFKAWICRVRDRFLGLKNPYN